MKLTTKLLATAALATGLAGAAFADGHEPLQVGFIYVGPTGDLGWTYEHDQGRLAVEEHFGDQVETVFLESVPEGADAERAITTMILGGADMVFTTSFGYMEATNAVAGQFPDVLFEHATGYLREHPNVSTYSARFYEGRAIQGHIAGQMTESNIIGYIASFPIPEVIRGINSAYLHARAVNPDVEFRVVWAYTWFDPAAEGAAAQALIDAGADVILQHTDSTAPQAAAQEAGIYSFGQASDMAQFAPAPRISSIIDNWAPYYIERVGMALDGTWEQADTWDGIGPGMVEIGEMTEAIPEEVRASAQEMIDAIAAGEYHPFTGPINRQDGTAWLAEGEVADDGTLAGMDFYVEGITGDIPN
ncbi:BMP family ABC transporter substrate-binding protein [Gymnodinialimonas ceratoperidinii]|uniref:BMP family ABC transporter substrate-binding protein n=1 Tax=Gymnodinialimonas ceratoperidinii TaxID=2856823 RepID=A0A8F6YCJ0_9RHOB|nr:BMP family ABC transporter substrate-binding protein [Gymnodinialimonas ceratoperidinii]QXT39370.1 BMP family ABC transporter substrate-binding protein [Gymnodinialimonas ceratoperidinii]